MERLVDDGASAHSSTTFFDDTSSASEALSAASSDVDDGVAATRCVRPLAEIEVHTGSRRPNPFPPWRLCLLPCFRFLTGALAVFVQGLMSL